MSYAHQNATLLPQSWKALITSLTKRTKTSKKAWVSIIDLAREHSDLFIEDCLQFLADSGMILWFQDSNDLGKVVFHNVQKVVEVFQCIFHHDLADDLQRKLNMKLDMDYEAKQQLHKFQQDGILSDQLFRNVLPESHHRQIFLMLFHDLNLCFKNAEEKAYFFPWFIQNASTETIEDIWPDNMLLKCC